MKKYMIFVFIVLIVFNLPLIGQNKQTNEPAPRISFKQLMHDYGKIFQGADGTFSFKFINTGNEPLILSRPRSSCGCTVPSWPKEPILPGDSAQIDVTYNTHILGLFNKSVAVYSNAAKTIVLRIKGRVVPRPKPMIPLKKDSASPVSK